MVHQHHRFAQRHRRELHARGYVAQRVDRRHRGLVVLVDHDRAVLALHHTPFLEAHIPHVGHAAGGIQHNIHRQQLCLGAVPLHDHLDTARCLRDPRHVGAQPQIDAGLAQLCGQEVAYIGVESAQYLFTPVQLRHARAQAIEDGRKLAGDVATAHHQQAFGKRVQVKHAVGRHNMLAPLKRWHSRRATRRNQNVFRRECLAVHFDRVRIQQPRPAFDNFDTRAVKQLYINAIEPRNLCRTIGLQNRPFKLWCLACPSKPMRLFKRLGIVRCIAVKLFRNTADVDAGATHVGYLGKSDLCATLGCHATSTYAAAATTDDEEVKIKSLHGSCFLNTEKYGIDLTTGVQLFHDGVIARGAV